MRRRSRVAFTYLRVAVKIRAARPSYYGYVLLRIHFLVFVDRLNEADSLAAGLIASALLLIGTWARKRVSR